MFELSCLLTALLVSSQASFRSPVASGVSPAPGAITEPRALFGDLHELLPPPPMATSHVAGDVDGDGDPDLVLAVGHQLLGGFSPSLWSGVGDGRMRADEQAFPGSFQTLRPVQALGDVDGDGDLDLIFGDRLLWNDGSGRFALDPSPLPGSVPSQIGFADLDADGDLDAYGATGPSDPNYLLVNQGGGVLASAGANLPPGATRGYMVTAGDVDGDGDGDLIVSSAGAPRLYRNLGSATFVDSSASLPAGASGHYLGLTDVDLDRDLDVLGFDALYRNDGDGVFSDASAALPSRTSRLGWTLDMDGDGDDDLQCWEEVWRNEGGNFVPVPDAMPPNSPRSPSLADVDQDGDVDLLSVFGSWVDVGFGYFDVRISSLLLNDGHGVFRTTKDRKSVV